MSTRDDADETGRDRTGRDDADEVGTTDAEATTRAVDGTETESIDLDDAATAGETDEDTGANEESGPATQDTEADDEREYYGVPELDEAEDDEEEQDEDGTLPPSEVIGRVLNVAVGAVVTVFVALLAIVAPTAGGTAQGVPIGMVGPQQTVDQLRGALDQFQPGGFDVQRFDNAEALRTATEDRDIYGGFVLNQDAPATYIATGANAQQANTLQSLGSQLGLTNVTDVATTTTQDPNALGITVTAVVLGLLGLGAAAALRHQLRGRLRAQVLGAVAVSVVLGLAFSGALHGLGSVEGGFWSLSGAVALAAGASLLLFVGLLGLAGLAGGAVALLLITIPGIGLAGLWTPPEALAGAWGTVGQYLPTGAAGHLLQSTAYMGGSGGLVSALVLLGWVVLGVVLALVAGLVARRAARRAAALEAAEAAEAEFDEDEFDEDEDDDEFETDERDETREVDSTRSADEVTATNERDDDAQDAEDADVTESERRS